MCDACKAKNYPMNADDAMSRANELVGESRIDKDRPAGEDGNVNWDGLTDDQKAIATLGMLVIEETARAEAATSVLGMFSSEASGAPLSFGPDGVKGRMSLN